MFSISRVSSVFSRGLATLELAMSVGLSLTKYNCERFLAPVKVKWKKREGRKKGK